MIMLENYSTEDINELIAVLDRVLHLVPEKAD